ncbi:2',5'-phosphodiesterase 12 [Anopheles nili]|uniref:2',5'-phosphodiesterase 12 n=1 Tax=Anopheles nili TaxID=185578 RepID=UPI00237BAD17|nr:2',5'-phosphodiesterase 12 [Anopheles nili]
MVIGHSYRISSNFLPKQSFEMKTAYFKHVAGDEQCQISFHLIIEKFKIDKVFNFNRSLTESIDNSLERIRSNVEKEFSKKLNRKKKVKKPSEVSYCNEVDSNISQVEAVPLQEPIDVTISTSNGKLSNITIAELLSTLNSLTEVYLTVLENKFQIAYNSPEVHALKLPSSVLADFFVYPSKFELHFATRECSEYKWYRGLMPKSGNAQQIQWEHVGNEFTYMAQKTDVGYYLKFSCTPKNDSCTTGPKTEIISPHPVQAGPGQCPFEVRHLFTQQKLKGSQFRVVSYNLLAELYSDSEYSRNVLFGYTLPYALDIDYRKQLFIKEILGYTTDIACLQEVDAKIFNMDLVPIFSQKSLAGHYQSKRNVAEGLATFYDVDKFILLEHDGIIVSEILERFPELWEKIRDNKPLVERIRNRSTALQLTFLRCKNNPSKHLFVVNTHLYFSPDADHVRLLQMGFAMLYVREQYDRICLEYGLAKTNIALLFCGDFNSVPECGIYKLLTEQYVGPDFPDWESNKNEAARNVSLTQPFIMGSACGCPEYTNYTVGFAACIDYIFYQTGVLKVNDVIPMPSREELSMYEALPSPVFPSDHIALVANLEWISLEDELEGKEN